MSLRRIDYTTELENLAREGFPCDHAAAQTRRGYGYEHPDALGRVWDALDAWVAAGRPREPYPINLHRRTPYVRLTQTLVDYYLEEVFADIGL